MFYLGGVGLSCFLTLLLLTKSKKSIADKILCGWLFIITIHLLLFYFTKMLLYPQLLAVSMPLPLMHGPLLFLYTIALTRDNLSWRHAFLHFLPAIAIYIYLIPFFTLPVEQKIFVFKNNGAGYEVFNLVRLVAYILSGVTYVILSTVALRTYRRSITQYFSSTEKINLEWLKYLIAWIGAIWLLVIAGDDDLTFGATVLFILFIGFFGIRQAGVFHSPIPDHQKTEPEEPQTQLPAERAKYQKSGLSADLSDSLHRSLSMLMSNEKLFRESELSLADLAGRLNTQPNYLSQVINEREGKNFYDYINSLRIEEFKRLASEAESRKFTLLALAQECGFNSKSSFNRYFKKATGQSPSEFVQAASDSAH